MLVRAWVLALLVCVPGVAQVTWDESKVQREPAGTSAGGQFATHEDDGRREQVRRLERKVQQRRARWPAATETARWMTSLGITTPVPVLLIEGHSDTIKVYGRVIKAPREIVNTWRSGHYGDLLLHELAHIASPYARSLVTPRDRAMEEAASESLARDLLPAWKKRFSRESVDSVSDDRYDAAVDWLRGVSSIASGGAEDSRDARRWRWRFVTGDRAAMLADAERIAGATLSPPGVYARSK